MRAQHSVLTSCLLALLPGLSSPTVTADALAPETGRSGSVEVGAGYADEASFTFGRYNGWDEDEAGLVANADVRYWQPDGMLGGSIDYLRLFGSDLGLDTRQAELVFGAAGSFEIQMELDQQQQVNNFTGRTPYRGGDSLVLPADWVASNNTSGMLAFAGVSHSFDRELERERWGISLNKALARGLSLDTSFSSEEKTGTAAMGAAFYIDASNGHAAVLPRPVDFTTNAFDLRLAFARNGVSLDLSYLYSSFENNDNSLSWQNPYYAGFGDTVDYPAGSGQMALEPDNEMHQLRLLGSYRLSQNIRLKIDGSYAEATQDDSFLPYTINTALSVTEGLPRRDLDGEVITSTFNGGVYYRATSKLSFEANYRYEDRDNDSPRDGYRYVRGDARNQPESAFTVYNTAHSRRVNRFDVSGAYRLPWASRLSATYAYEEIDRENAAVRETEDDIYTLSLSSRPISHLRARLEANYSERAASTYHWEQAYFALLDTELINRVPDSQRFTNHPLLYQYHLANREQTQGKVNLAYVPDSNWSINFDYLYEENEYEESQMGLQEEERDHATLSASLMPSDTFSMTIYYSYDAYSNEMQGRAFRGGIEKNPFEIYPPLPQASDPARNWFSEGEDESQSVGASLLWTVSDRLNAELDYSYVESTGEQSFETFGAPDLDDTALPDLENTQHNLLVSGTYLLDERLSLKIDYRFYHYDDDNWAIDDVNYNTLDKVLWTGESSADDDVHFFQASVIYRLE